MSNDNDNDSNKPGADDDGWGDAGKEAQTPEPVVPAAAEGEWVDPANLEERVAALRENRELPAAPKVVVEESATAEGVSPEPDAAPAQEAPPVAPAFQFPAVQVPAQEAVQVPAQEAVQVPAQEAVQVPAQEAVQVPAQEEVQVPAQEAVVVDKPHWSPTPGTVPPSDMRAAAEVLAQKESAPAAKKRRKIEKRNQKDPRTQLTRRQQLTLIGGGALFILAGVGALLGWMNNQHYYLVCGTRIITAEQGSFWPWGRNPLPGEAFKGIEGDHPCTNLEFDNRNDLEEAFLDALIERATRLLTSGDPEQVASAEQELQQALLLSRDPERGKQRSMAERLQGDVSYWRGAAEIQKALEILHTSATYFEEAAAKRPRHSNDASAWAEHARFIGSEIEKGPRSLRKDESPKEEPHFQGLSQPPPDAGSDTEPEAAPAVNTSKVVEPPVDAGVAPEEPAADPADASLPKGGVLL
jgi:hypothetical protein